MAIDARLLGAPNNPGDAWRPSRCRQCRTRFTPTDRQCFAASIGRDVTADARMDERVRLYWEFTIERRLHESWSCGIAGGAIDIQT